ncbi:hypothetical protein HHX47_DHR2000300 [Lentinula edodes]|nr:hypothetical protein HHX47_DHR2000300 [Lentinula edodes]
MRATGSKDKAAKIGSPNADSKYHDRVRKFKCRRLKHHCACIPLLHRRARGSHKPHSKRMPQACHKPFLSTLSVSGELAFINSADRERIRICYVCYVFSCANCAPVSIDVSRYLTIYVPKQFLNTYVVLLGVNQCPNATFNHA